MPVIPQQELRNIVAEVLRRAEAGEQNASDFGLIADVVDARPPE